MLPLHFHHRCCLLRRELLASLAGLPAHSEMCHAGMGERHRDDQSHRPTDPAHGQSGATVTSSKSLPAKLPSINGSAYVRPERCYQAIARLPGNLSDGEKLASTAHAGLVEPSIIAPSTAPEARRLTAASPLLKISLSRTSSDLAPVRFKLA